MNVVTKHLKSSLCFVTALAAVIAATLGAWPGGPHTVDAGTVEPTCNVSFTIFGGPTVEADPGETVSLPFTVAVDVFEVTAVALTIDVSLPPGIAASYAPTSAEFPIQDPVNPSTVTRSGTITATVPLSAVPGESWVFTPNTATAICESPVFADPLVDTAAGAGFRIVALGTLPTSTPTSTSTPIPTNTPTATSTATATATNTPTATATQTPTPTATATSSPTPTTTATPSPTPTVTATPSPTATQTATVTPSATATTPSTPTATGTSGPTPTSTESPMVTSTATTAPDNGPTATGGTDTPNPPSATPTESGPTSTATTVAGSVKVTATATSPPQVTPTFTATVEGPPPTPTAPPAASANGLVLEMSEVRQSTGVTAEAESDVARYGLGLIGALALAAGGFSVWRGYNRQT